MTSDTLLAALGLAFIIEALPPFIAPRAWREAVSRLQQMRDGQIRFIALLGLLAGLALIWLAGG